MNAKTYQLILVSLTALWSIAITACVSTIFWRHQAAVHHAARFHANTWGIVTFEWNDEYAQIIVVDPADRITPPAK
jgi:urea transporter